MLATSDAAAKKLLLLRDEYFVALMRPLFALPLLILTLVLVKVPPLDRTFWIATLTAIPLEVIAVILYTRALRVSPISFSIPFLTLTPVFLIVVSYILLGEKISPGGAAGIMLIAAGGYVLNIHEAWKSPLEPVRAVLREEGATLMIAVAFIFSITSALGKMAVEHSSPLFFGGFYFVPVTILLAPLAIRNTKERMDVKKGDILPLLLAGITYALMIIFHMIAVKRLAIFFSILYGYFIFREKNIRERMLGSMLMFAGFLLIVLKH
jgi:drug/metabolite transporter (DMT)-like permease